MHTTISAMNMVLCKNKNCYLRPHCDMVRILPIITKTSIFYINFSLDKCKYKEKALLAKQRFESMQKNVEINYKKYQKYVAPRQNTNYVRSANLATWATTTTGE